MAVGLTPLAYESGLSHPGVAHISKSTIQALNWGMNIADCTRNMARISLLKKTLFCIPLAMSLSVLAEGELPEIPKTGMDVIQQNRHGEFLAVPDVDWSQYSGVQIEVTSVEFRDRWKRDQRWRSGNIVREKDEIRIKTETAELVTEVLGRELSRKGDYIVTDEGGADVMRMSIRVKDLDIVAPDRVRDHIGSSFTDSQLNMTLELDIHDSLSGDVLATTRRHEEDPYKGYMEWTTSPTNRRAAVLMLERYSSWLLEGLAQASGRE